MDMNKDAIIEEVMELAAVTKVYNDILDLDDQDEFRKYQDKSDDQLAAEFTLNKQQAGRLEMILSGKNHWSQCDPKYFFLTLGEAEHGSYDGWTDMEKTIIAAFLADITLGAQEWKKMDDEEKAAG